MCSQLNARNLKIENWFTPSIILSNLWKRVTTVICLAACYVKSSEQFEHVFSQATPSNGDSFSLKIEKTME